MLHKVFDTGCDSCIVDADGYCWCGQKRPVGEVRVSVMDDKGSAEASDAQSLAGQPMSSSQLQVPRWGMADYLGN